MTLPSNIRLLDVGGTFVKCADGRMVPIDATGDRSAIAVSLQNALGDLSGVKAVGVAIPGPFDFDKGIFRMQHKFAAVYGLSFREVAAVPEVVQLRFCHDVNTQLLGELTPRSAPVTGMITLGTGLGFSYAVSGVVQKAPSGSPAIGIYNLPWKDGILEDYVSKRGIMRAYALSGGSKDLSVKEIASRAYAGEMAARQAFSLAAEALASATKDLVKQLSIGELIFGGQISRSFSLMEPVLKEIYGAGLRLRPASDIDGAAMKGLLTLFDK